MRVRDAHGHGGGAYPVDQKSSPNLVLDGDGCEKEVDLTELSQSALRLELPDAVQLSQEHQAL